VYKQIQIDTNFELGKRVKKKRAHLKKSTKEAKVRIGL